MKIGDVSTHSLKTIKKTVANAGFNATSLLDSFGISEAVLANPYARVSLSKYMRIGAESIELTRTPWFGLLLGANTHAGDLGLPGFASITAPTLEDALSTLVRYEWLNSKNIKGRSRYFIESNTGYPVCELFSLSPYNRFNYFCVDSILTSWYSLSKWVTGQDSLLKHIDIEYQDIGYKETFEAFFQCPVHFGQERNALVFNKGTNALLSNFANAATHQQMCILCDRELATLTGDNTLRDHVVEAIVPLLQGHSPTIETLATKMGVTSWTLRRKLKKEGTTFQALMDQTRKELAESYVGDSIHNFTEITYILGFSSPVAFHRAFKRWFSVSPGRYRKTRGQSQ